MAAWLQLAQRVRDLEIRLAVLRRQAGVDGAGPEPAGARDAYLDALRELSRAAALALAEESGGGACD